MNTENKEEIKRGYRPDDDFYSPNNTIDAMLESATKERAIQRSEKINTSNTKNKEVNIL